ncbi:MAG: 1-(5-phosphoribosyl)-5-((5-phosphoribosylamino)methylideneamino)imidazole-4-carboxamide isomerase [Actinobacteria bacterium]|nr:1-(5-phosphoribosyl)-5-((5-phosphoribosylamino)methylideneamino)imidazole-4-carboxamide isomerase [Actinomycetota bacterium]
MQFIFMLTHNDRTVENVLDVYREVRDTPLQLLGFKDVGVTRDTMRSLADLMHEDGRSVFLEVVSISQEDELASIEAALEAGVDYILGGTHYSDVLAMIDGAPVRYYPFPGTIVGHPSELQGSIEDIAAHAKALTARPGVHGLDLLAYRHRTVDPVELTRAVVASSSGPVIAAGSVDRAERIRALRDAGAWAFTIGGAIFDGLLPGAPSLAAQIEWTLEVATQP